MQTRQLSRTAQRLLLLLLPAAGLVCAARAPLLQSFYSAAEPAMSLRHCEGPKGNVYTTAPVWGETDFMWREEPAVNGSTDAAHVSLRVFNIPDTFLCASDRTGSAVVVSSPTAPLLCTFRKVAGLSDVGLVSFVNEGRYLTMATSLTGYCASWFVTGKFSAFDVQLSAFPASPQSATWIPVDTTIVSIKAGFYADERKIQWYYCSGSLVASSSLYDTAYDYNWVISKGLRASDPLAVSIRPLYHMDLYVCFNGTVATLSKPDGIEENCTFVVSKDPQGRQFGVFSLYNPRTRSYLALRDAADTDKCATAAVAHLLGSTDVGTDDRASWSFRRVLSPPILANVSATPPRVHKINARLGITLEEVNFGLEGGLHAQLIRNRDFEALGRGVLGDGAHASATPVATDMRPWTYNVTSGAAAVALQTSSPLYDTNPVHVAVSSTGPAEVQLDNPGFWGIACKPGSRYAGRVRAASTCSLAVSAFLRSPEGAVVSSQATKVVGAGTGWSLVEFALTGKAAAPTSHFVFEVKVAGECTVRLDSFSLVPADAVKGLFRRDLYDALAALKPSFLQFPWGSDLEGASEATRWHMAPTLGDADARPGHYNAARGFWSTDAFGLYEFLVLSEALGARPILSLFAGHINGTYPASSSPAGLNTLEFAMGSAATKYGALRGKMGHPQPFGVSEVQIGSGLETSTQDYARFFGPMLRAIAAAFPSVNITASAAPTSNNPCMGNRTYCTTWVERFEQFQAAMQQGQHRYDGYDRRLPMVAVTNAHMPTDAATADAAAAEGAWLVGTESNADVVSRYSLVPALRNDNWAQANVGLVAFDSAQAAPLPSYHVHRMVADTPCSWTLATTAPASVSAAACRTALGGVVFRAANWNAVPIAVTFALAGTTAAPASVVVTVLSGASPGSRSPQEVVPVTRVLPGSRRVTVVLPWFSFAVVQLVAALPMDNETASSSSAEPDACAEHTLCRTCLGDSRCGWCEDAQQCVAATGSGQPPPTCRLSDWRYDSCAPVGTGKDSINTAAIIGGCVGGGVFCIAVVVVALVVGLVCRGQRRKAAAPNIPIDTTSVNFVAASVDTVFETRLGPASSIAPGFPGTLSFSTSPVPPGSSGSSILMTQRVDLNVMPVSPELVLPSVSLAPVLPFGIIPPPADPLAAPLSSAAVCSSHTDGSAVSGEQQKQQDTAV
eukprot:m51a1_g5261 putative alpha-L-arabinofuranosidase-like protein (1184) ;mRNA; r:108169-112330